MPNRSLLTTGLILALMTGFASAKTIVDDKIGVQIELPDDWKWETGDRTTVSTPEGFSLVVFRVDEKMAFEIANDASKYFGSGITDVKANNDEEKLVMNGLPATKFTGHAMRDGNRVAFAVVLVSKAGVGTMVALAVGPETEFKRHLPDSDRAFDSVKPKP